MNLCGTFWCYQAFRRVARTVVVVVVVVCFTSEQSRLAVSRCYVRLIASGLHVGIQHPDVKLILISNGTHINK